MSYHGTYGMEAPNYINRKEQPAISVYFIRDDNNLPPHKLSCLFCKRTIMDSVKGTIDKIVDGPLPAEDHDFASNIQCKLCGQKYRVMAGVGVSTSQVTEGTAVQ